MDTNQPRAKKGSPCPQCGNLLRLRSDQLGEQVKCPKCGTVFTVGRPDAGRHTAPASLDYEPEVPLRRSTIVPEVPVEIIHEEPPQLHVPDAVDADQVDLDKSAPLAQDVAYEVDWSTGGEELEMEQPHQRPVVVEEEYLESARAQGLVRSQERAYVPRYTFFSTVFDFPWLGPNAWRWTMIAFGLAMTGVIFIPIVELMRKGPDLMMVFLSLFASLIVLLTGAAVAPCFLAAVQDTADGFREVQESTLPDLDQWFFSFLSLLYVVALSGAIGYPLSLIEQIGPVAIPISMLVLFPVLVLSAMESDSFMFPYSPRILRTIPGVWPTWLGFYIVSTLLAGGWFLATAAGLERQPLLTVVVAALALAALVLIYARLLGRVAWRAGILLEGADDEAAVPSGTAKRRRSQGGRRRRRIDFPPELDQAARFVDPPPARPPRG